jgi:hypothetical protein
LKNPSLGKLRQFGKQGKILSFGKDASTAHLLRGKWSLWWDASAIAGERVKNSITPILPFDSVGG